MRVGVLSDTRVPTKPHGGHGLGRVAVDIATGLVGRGHDVTLYAGPGSWWPGKLVTHEDEVARVGDLRLGEVDAWIDLSHYHTLGQVYPDWPAVHYIMDTECTYQPPNTLVANEFGLQAFPSGVIVRLGIDVDAIPFNPDPDGYLCFVGKLRWETGAHIAVDIEKRSGQDVLFVGPGKTDPMPRNYKGIIQNDKQLYEFLGAARALLSPRLEDAGGRVNLESAACGTPVLCLDGTGTQYHVKHCVSGFVCADTDEMIDALQDIPLLDRCRAREWVADVHSMAQMVSGVENALQRVLEGERW